MISLLEQVRDGKLQPDTAADRLQGVARLPFACLDLDRQRRRRLPEVIFGSGKTADQIVSLVKTLNEAGQNAFVTRVDPEKAAVIKGELPGCHYHRTARILTRDIKEIPLAGGTVAVVCAGTSDLPVAEEAAITIERMGVATDRITDVGVAGLHRLLGNLERLEKALAVVVVAGMEGALPSVVGGLINRPIIAVPSSIGYGANFQGLTPLLAMLNSCAPGITVVNIDNGFGAGIAAATIVLQSASGRHGETSNG